MSTRRSASAWLATALVSALLGGCGGLALEVPVPPLPVDDLQPASGFAAADPGAPQPTEADLRWWTRFDDPQLAAAVEDALDGDPAIAISRERIVQAQALLRSARAQRGPQVSAGAAVSVERGAGSADRSVAPRLELGLDWDLDLWGGRHQAERSAAARLLRSEDLLQVSRLASAGLAARAAIEWREAQRDAQLLGAALAVQSQLLEVAQVRVKVGLAPRLDAERALADQAATQADAASAAVRIRQARAALRVLAGEPVSTLPPLAPAAADPHAAAVRLPNLQGALPVARPLDLLRLRPDLRAAEHALLAAAADVGVARAALYPSLRLPGTLLLATGAGLLDQLTSAIALVLDAKLHDGGAGQADVDAARSRLREAVLIYRQTLLQALQQIDAALVASAGTQRRIAALQRAVEASQAALAQSITLYEAGLSAQLDVLDARRLALLQQRSLARAQADAARQAVSLFEATGLIEPAPRPGPVNLAVPLPRPG